MLDDHLKVPRPAPPAAPARGPRAPRRSGHDRRASDCGLRREVPQRRNRSAFTIAVSNGKLTLQRDTDAQLLTLQPVQPRRSGPRFIIRFERKNGRVPSLIVDAGRVRGIVL